MSSIIVKIIYLFMCTFCSLIGIKYKKAKNQDFLMLLFFLSLALCWGVWGISTMFHNAEGYPPQWLFYLSSTPVFLVTLVMVFKLKK